MDIETGSKIAGAGLDIATSIGNIGSGKRQHRRSKELMDIQFRNQQELNKGQYENQKRMWDETNAEAQVKHYEKAGLNVGMMYGGSGAGGATTGSVGGGSASVASGGTGVPVQAGAGMDIATKMAGIELMKANAEKATAEANRIKGVETENIGADTVVKTEDAEVKRLQAENLKLQNRVQSESIESLIDTVKANADKAQSEARSGLVKANVDETTQEATENKIRSESMNEAFKLTMMKADKNLTEEKTRAITQELAQEWERLTIELKKVGVGKMQNAINEFTAKVNARLGQGNLNMRGIEAGLNAAGKLIR